MRGTALVVTIVQGLPLWVAWILGTMLCVLEWKKCPRAYGVTCSRTFRKFSYGIACQLSA